MLISLPSGAEWLLVVGNAVYKNRGSCGQLFTSQGERWKNKKWKGYKTRIQTECYNTEYINIIKILYFTEKYVFKLLSMIVLLMLVALDGISVFENPLTNQIRRRAVLNVSRASDFLLNLCFHCIPTTSKLSYTFTLYNYNYVIHLQTVYWHLYGGI